MANCTDTSSGSCSTQAEFIIYIYVFTVVAFLGIILNILNLSVFCRRTGRMNRTTSNYLMSLAVFDLSFLIAAAMAGVSRCVEPREQWQKYAKSYYEVFIYIPFANTFASASVYLTVVISIERYLSIKLPFVKRRLCKEWMPVLCIVMCFVVAVGMNMPYFFYKFVDKDGNIVRTEFGNQGFEDYGWARLALNKIIPIIIVVIFNSLLVATVAEGLKRTKMLTDTAQARRRHEQSRLTIMMVSISAVFIVCHSVEPLTTQELYTAMFGPCSIYTTTYKALTVVTNTLETFSFASNFIFYCAFNSDIVKILKQNLCCRSGQVGHISEGETEYTVK